MCWTFTSSLVLWLNLPITYNTSRVEWADLPLESQNYLFCNHVPILALQDGKRAQYSLSAECWCAHIASSHPLPVARVFVLGRQFCPWAKLYEDLGTLASSFCCFFSCSCW